MADAIVAASSPVAETVEPHRTVNEGGVMRMLPARDLALPAGNLVEFKPGGLHIMLIGLKAPLRQGDSFALTLRFRTAAPVTVQVKIGAPGASGPGHSH
jgi:copper(I)-binding protein